MAFGIEDFVGGLTQTFSNGFQAAGNAIALTTANIINTQGVATVNSQGQLIGEGWETHAGDEILGGVTGRNAARDANYQNQLDVNKAAAQQELLLDAQRKQKQNNDVAASTTAAALRSTAALQSKNSLGFSTAVAPNPGADFLGL